MSTIPASRAAGNDAKSRRTTTPAAAHYEALLRQLQLALPANASPAIGVTSCLPGQGTSAAAANLAVAAANVSRQALLVDANVEHGSVGKVFKVSAERGLSDFLSSEASTFSFDETTDGLISASPVENLSLMLPGRSGGSRQPCYDSRTVGELIDTLKHIFQFTVFDLPVANELTTCFSLASRLDGVLLVMSPGKVTEVQAKRAVQQLRNAKCEILGAVWIE